MIELALASLLWAFSFGLIKQQLAGLDPTWVAALRLLLSALVFAPFLRRRPRPLTLRLVAIGGVQFGLMYLLYIASYRHLQAYEVAVFTVTTPLYIVLVDAVLRRAVRAGAILAAVTAVVGALVIAYREVDTRALQFGFVLVQLANLCFAVGQVAYRRVMRREDAADVPHREAFGLLYLGAVVVAGVAAGFLADRGAVALTRDQALVILYLGLLPSGLGFYLWNRGACRVSAAVLAVFNNLKVPLGVVCALLFFGESADWRRLVVGSVVLALAFGVAAMTATPRVRRGAP